MLDSKNTDFSKMSIGGLIEETLDTFHELEREWDRNKNKINLEGWRRIRRKLDAICHAKKVLRKKMIATEKDVKAKRKAGEDIDYATIIYSA
jgi:hypothetical protein